MQNFIFFQAPLLASGGNYYLRPVRRRYRALISSKEAEAEFRRRRISIFIWLWLLSSICGGETPFAVGRNHPCTRHWRIVP